MVLKCTALSHTLSAHRGSSHYTGENVSSTHQRMELREIWRAALYTIFMLLVFGSELLTGFENLPAPQNVLLSSIDMIHLLRWSPVLVSGGSVRYTVEFQGEHEREYRNGLWQEVLECLDIVHPVCNVTADISSNVDYDLRVRATQEGRVSPWASIKNMFNRQDTVLTVPGFNVTARKESLQVDFTEKPKSIVFVLKYWPKGAEHQAVQVTSEQNPFVLVRIEEGVTYCFQAWTYVEVIHKSSNVSELQCVSIPSTLPSWVAPTAVTASLIAVIVVSIILLVALQKHLHLMKYFCCPKEMLPDSLDVDGYRVKLYGEKTNSETWDTVLILPEITLNSGD
ncbi:cytokine receptor family member B16 [Polyodon spathula]|uniref:cytokine receptor family member B16 n=1 Tax=Polyodon spathula TaxID=7913 RepID=UPI001B7E5CFF|nr:cytokine receptor family member B16 [Polyodon spathula]